MGEELPSGGVELSPEELAEIDARWAGCWRPEEVARRLAGVSVPWSVAGGWALDLFRGAQSREHGDLEIAIPAAGFAQVRERFPEFVFDAISDGRVWPDAGAEALAGTYQTWLRDPATDGFLVDVFREPHDGNVWICRRDPAIRRPYSQIISHTPDGIPYLAPELVLLFKAKHARPKDQADFEGVVPLMSAGQRSALGELLELVHPGHRWLAEL